MDHLIELRIAESVNAQSTLSFIQIPKKWELVRQLWTGYLVRSKGSVEWNAVVLDSP
jgi:hypothetical protein